MSFGTEESNSQQKSEEMISLAFSSEEAGRGCRSECVERRSFRDSLSSESCYTIIGTRLDICTVILQNRYTEKMIELLIFFTQKHRNLESN